MFTGGQFFTFTIGAGWEVFDFLAFVLESLVSFVDDEIEIGIVRWDDKVDQHSVIGAIKRDHTGFDVV